MGGLLLPPSAGAFEAWDGRFQAHGFAEMQIRAISADYSEDLDLTQWYNVFNLELELDVVEEPVGPLDTLDLYIRAEVRYDCVWTRACGLFPSANAFGDRAKKLPQRLSNAKERDQTMGAVNISGPDLDRLRNGKPAPQTEVTAFATLADTNPISFAYIFQNYSDFRFTEIYSRSGTNFGTGRSALGPWLPKNKFNSNAAIADRANPFDASESSGLPGLPAFGSGALPFRPIPVQAQGGVGVAKNGPRGIYIPSEPMQREINQGFDDMGKYFNFTQSERAWNRGQSQQQTKELKEAYVEAELFDGILWTRLGRQSIVWGKTELFRTTDQFNPTDLALASLPSLEESRIPTWSGRFILNVWEHPLPVEDLRLEFAFNFDVFQSTDLGACGEPYTPDPVCGATYGGYVHSITNVGVLGIRTPPDPWEDIKGLELGGRIEWRAGRFSFALMDFWGYDDAPYTKRITTYSRNVDPNTGIPRPYYEMGSGPRGNCTATLVGVQYQFAGNCLTAGPTQRTVPNPGGANPVFTDANNNAVTYTSATLANPTNALEHHHASLQNFTFICSTTIAFTALDPTACALNVWGSPAVTGGITTIGEVLGGMIAGNPAIHQTFSGVLGIVGAPLAYLTDDSILLGSPVASREFVPGAAANSPEGLPTNVALFGKSLSALLTPEQEALLGCGPWWGTNCDADGIDLLNSDASTLLQSFVGFEGTGPSDTYVIPLGAGGAAVGAPQPGHSNYVGGPVCTTGDIRNDGRNDQLPGCRSPGTPGYNQAVDGSATLSGYVGPPALAALNAFIPYQCAPLLGGGCAATPALGNRNPLHGQQFSSEMAVASWNFLMLLVANSASFNGATVASAFSTAPKACSYRQPQFCETAQSIWAVAGVLRNTPRAGGNYSFGRRTFIWHSAGDALLAFQKRNVLGLSMDFAEDRTKSNWSMEFTWFNKRQFTDNSKLDNVDESGEFNLTISADRPTFVNFLNQNRTFLFNTQWFFQYRPGYNKGWTSNGPFNVLATVAVQTGYFQDRLLPSMVVVWDFQSASGAFLPQIGYRFNEAFSLTLGMAVFTGRQQLRDMPVNPIGGSANYVGRAAYQEAVENGLSAVRSRDEFFLRLRYTF